MGLDPITIALVLGAAGAVSSGVSGFQQGKFNQRVAQQQAKAARQAQEFNEVNQRRQFAQLQGRNRARVATSGIEFSGSPLEVAIENEFQFESEIAAQRFNTLVGAQQSLAQGELARFKGTSDLLGGLLQGGSFAAAGFSELGGATSGDLLGNTGGATGQAARTGTRFNR